MWEMSKKWINFLKQYHFPQKKFSNFEIRLKNAIEHSCPKHVVIEKKVQANLITKLKTVVTRQPFFIEIEKKNWGL